MHNMGTHARALPVLLSAPVAISQHPGGLPHVKATIKKMGELARAAQHTFPIRNLATRITHHVPSKAPAAELRALYNWVRDHIRYRFDPVGLEWVQSPERTIQEQAGDCDDMATLLAALAGALGHRWRFRTVGDSPSAQRHVQVQAWTGRQWLDLDPVLEPTQRTTAPRTDPGTFGLAARGAEHLWTSEGTMLSGPTSPRDRMLWSVVPYFQSAPPWPPYGGIQPLTPGRFPRTDPRYRSADAPGYEGGRSLAVVYRLPPGAVASQGQLSGLGRGRFRKRLRKFAKKAFKAVVATSIPGAGVVMAARKIRKKRGKKRLLPRMLSGPTNAAERELWNWIPYDPITGGPNLSGPGVLLSFPVGAFGGLGDDGETLIPYDLEGLGRGFLKKLKRVAKKVGKVVKKVVKNPVFQAIATTALQAIPGAGQAAGAALLAAKAIKAGRAIAKGIKGAKTVVKAIKGVKKGVQIARRIAKGAKAPRAALRAVAARAARKGATALRAALPVKGDPSAWKKPHASVRAKYPKNARQLFDKKAGVFRVFVPSQGLTASKIAQLRARGGKARPRRLAGLGAIRPTISFSLGATQSQAREAARSPELVALALKAVRAVDTFTKNRGRPPAVHMPAVHAFQHAENNLTVDGLYGTNTHAAISWYLQGTGTKIPPYAPGLRTALTWSPPLAALPPTAPTPQPPAPSAPRPPTASPVAPKPPAATPKPPPGASFPAPGGYVEIGTETNNPGLTPAGYTAPDAPAPAPAVPGTPKQPGAPTGGAPKPPVPGAQAAQVQAAAEGDDDADDASAAEAAAPVTPGPVAVLTPTGEREPGAALVPTPGTPVIDVYGPTIVDVPTTPGAQVTPAPIVVPPGLPPTLPVMPGPVPPVPLTPGPAVAPAPRSGGSGEIVLWASLLWLWSQQGRRAA